MRSAAPDRRAPQQIDGRHQRRLIEPDVAIEHRAALHLQGGGERQSLLPTTRPRDADAPRAEPRIVRGRRGFGADYSYWGGVYWTRAAGEKTANMDIQEQLAYLRKTVGRGFGRPACTVDGALPASMAARSDRRFIEDLLSGQVVETPRGKHFETEKLYARHQRYGSYDISDLIELPRGSADRALGRRDCAVRIRRAGPFSIRRPRGWRAVQEPMRF